MEIKYKSTDSALIANLSGELDECTAEYVRMSLDTVLSDLRLSSPAKVVLDFGSVTFMDSTGIGVLLGRYNKFSKQGIEIAIKNASGHVDRILKMTGIYEIMPKIS
ncbi:MAG: anti-sigma factor antagonist [Clostridia bacterium]|nr:anti-sigma factor antagonist [Clostridia bacterium]